MSVFAIRSLRPPALVAHGALALLQSAALVVFGGSLAAIHGFSLDDAWIHQVVARTFAGSGTLGYIAGHHGAGATSYLWAALLAINYRFVHADPVVFTLALNVTLTLLVGQSLLVMLLGARPGERTHLWSFQSVAIAGLATFGGNFLWFAFSGMEVMLFLSLSLGAIVLAASEDRHTRVVRLLAGACAGAVALTRPEGVLLCPLLVAASLRWDSNRRDTALLVAPWAVALAAYVGTNLHATGTPLPSTLAGRRWLWLEDSGAGWATQLGTFGNDWLRQLKEYTLGTSSHVAFWISIGCAAVGFLRVVRGTGRALKLVVAWALVHIAAYVVLLPALGHGGRYQPLTPLVYLLLVGIGAVDLGAWLIRSVARDRAERAQVVLATLGGLAPWVGLVGVGVRDWRGDHTKAVAHVRDTEVALGPVIDSLPLAARVASFDIGGSGFFAHRPVLDLGGLVDGNVVALLREGRIWEYLRDHSIDYVVLPLGYSPPTFPDAINFGQRLHLFENPALDLNPIRELQTEPAIWGPGILCTANAAPTQMVFHVDYTGRAGPDPPRPLGAGGAIEDPEARVEAREREAVTHGLHVLSGYGIDVRLVVSDERDAAALSTEEWLVRMGAWGVSVTPPRSSAVPAEAVTGLAADWLEDYIDARDFGGAARMSLYAVAEAQRRFVDPGFLPTLPPANAVQGAPDGSPRTTLLWGIPVAALILALGSRLVRRRLGRLGLAVPAAFLLVACTRRLPDVALDGDSAVRELLDRGHAGVDERVEGKTALHVAAERGDVRTIRVLIGHHADVGGLDAEGEPPLLLAARGGHTDCVDALLAGGADPNQESAVTAVRPIHVAVLSGAPDTLQRLLRGGADPNATSSSGETALHLAARLDPPRAMIAMDVLLAHGANAEARDVRGFTPLHVAAARDAPLVVRLYRDMKFDLNARSAWGQTPLDVALTRRADRAADALFAAGARTEMTKDPAPPLLDAARMNDVGRVAGLLAAGVDREQTHDGKTARDVARESGSEDALRLLGAPPTAHDHQ
jgi:ankyrin repeat protein